MWHCHHRRSWAVNPPFPRVRLTLATWLTKLWSIIIVAATHRYQKLRKKAGLAITDAVDLYFQPADAAAAGSEAAAAEGAVLLSRIVEGQAPYIAEALSQPIKQLGEKPANQQVSRCVREGGGGNLPGRGPQPTHEPNGGGDSKPTGSSVWSPGGGALWRGNLRGRGPQPTPQAAEREACRPTCGPMWARTGGRGGVAIDTWGGGLLSRILEVQAPFIAEALSQPIKQLGEEPADQQVTWCGRGGGEPTCQAIGGEAS